MKFHPRRCVAASAAVLAALTACTSDDDGDGADPGAADGSARTPSVLADLDRLIADADAYRFVADVHRGDASFADGERTRVGTDISAVFRRATDGNAAALLAEVRQAYADATEEGCRIDGRVDGVDFDDSGPVEDSDFAEYVRAGDALPVSDEAGALGALVAFDGGDEVVEDPYYEWDLPDGLDNIDVIGAIGVDVPGDVFPGLGTLTLPAVTLDGVAADAMTVDAPIRWTPSEEEDRTLVVMEVRGDDDADGILVIECVTDDDGSFVLPDATLARLPASVTGFVGYGVERTRHRVVGIGEAVVITGSAAFRAVP